MGDLSSTWIQRRENDILEHSRRLLDAVQLCTPTIQSLPNELLTDIFRSTCTTVGKPPSHTPIKPGILLQIPPPMSKFSESPKFSPFIATLLSLVCKRWRLVILSDLILWSDITISPGTGATDPGGALNWAVRSAIRSYPTPMSLSVTNSSGSPVAPMHLIPFINNNGQRIRELKAYLRMIGDSARDFAALQSPMPNLEVLEVGCSPDWGTPPGVGLPQLFSRNYPRLKHLSIQHFTTVPPRAFTNLVTLVLSYSLGRVTSDDFLALVAGSPRLEVLWVKRYKVTRSRNFNPLAPVPLPRLSSITLENCDSSLILSHLKIPDTATLRIMYPMHYLERRPRKALTDSFPQNPAIIGSLRNVRTLSYGVDETTAVLFLKDSRGKKSVLVKQGHEAPELELFPSAGRTYSLFDARFHGLFALDPGADLLGQLTTLELDLRGLPNSNTGGSNLSFWLALFDSTPLLEVLRASYSYFPPMLDGLNPSNKGRKVLCPSLRTLQLDIRTGAFDLKSDWFLHLIDTTRWRGKCGSPFRDLFVCLTSSGYGHEFTLPPDTVRAMFSLRDAGVVNMKYSNGNSSHKFGESPVFISPHAMSDSHFSFSQIRTIMCCRNFRDRSGKTGRPPLIGRRFMMSWNSLPRMARFDSLSLAMHGQSHASDLLMYLPVTPLRYTLRIYKVGMCMALFWIDALMATVVCNRI
ncbi:hypothetical protein BJ322DRAFT_1072633 [Thelephora terrestris]|uniref:F-box domain-containing protein n=1 Tax=Thelephora terrestris TaxID=56493 RepID=A0A9P6HAV8_9AGAM|nr:hypothetical protein BJ322DRAFT_1072633 [Thelephora terrestris]